MSIPVYDIDFYSDAVIADPYPHYKAMRDLGPVVHLPQNDGYAITRFADVQAALRNCDVFLSGRGVMMNEPTNAAAAGNSVLNMDGALHRQYRQTMAKPLMPAALTPLREEIQSIADVLVDDLVGRGQFDGVKDFAHILPLTLVTKLVGLPESGQKQMLAWAAGIFNVMGSINDRFAQGLPARDKAIAYLSGLKPEDMVQGSWGARLFDLVATGAMSDAQMRERLFDYVAPALDTTINASSSALWLFGLNPKQWDAVRANPSLISVALDEAMRLESPIRAFSRCVGDDVDVDGSILPAGSRVLLVYASANRDERRWENPEVFDVRRRAPQEQLSFGTGVHMCVGMHLARMEMRCLFTALARRVAKFSVGNPVRDLHQVLRGLKSFDVQIEEVIS